MWDSVISDYYSISPCRGVSDLFPPLFIYLFLFCLDIHILSGVCFQCLLLSAVLTLFMGILSHYPVTGFCELVRLCAGMFFCEYAEGMSGCVYLWEDLE